VQRAPASRTGLSKAVARPPPGLRAAGQGAAPAKDTVRASDDGERLKPGELDGLVRDLPAAYVSEHIEHAYALTGHGMQTGTLETAIVVASPRDLTAGWSYTALSRARGNTRLLVYDYNYANERSEFAPADQAPTAARGELLTRVQRRMLERDDEDLAIEQLPGPGRANDPELNNARTLTAEPPQERAAMRAEPTPPATATPARLRELRERVQQLQAQLATLPTRQLQRIEDLDARAVTLTTQREHLTQRLTGLPEPRQRLGREQDPHAIERTHLTSALQASERELNAVLTQRRRLERELGDPVEARAERDGLEHALGQTAREHTETRNDLAERELHAPGAWVQATFGERPNEPQPHEAWERGVRQAARYRVQYDITGSSDTLGPRPEQHQQQRDWEHAREAIESVELRLGRSTGIERGIDLGIGL
jgi:chaperonin cofactor prefoldin